MFFTKSKEEREYERMMQQKPRFDKRQQEQAKQRDCPYCLHFDEIKQCCKLKTCIVFKK